MSGLYDRILCYSMATYRAPDDGEDTFQTAGDDQVPIATEVKEQDDQTLKLIAELFPGT